MKSETAKLPKGQTYPLKPSALEAALARADVQLDTHLIRSPGSAFYAYFWPPNENVPYERLYVRAGSVAREQSRNAPVRVEEAVLPALLDWVVHILELDAKSPVRREQQFIDLRLI